MAANPPDILDDQVRLSEQLQLLSQFGYSNPQMSFRGVGHPSIRRQDHDTKTDIHLLDTIAAALTTGKSGDVFAAAFDRRESLTLVLAKNGPVTDEDDQAVRDLFNTLTDPTTEDAFDALPFLFARCGENIMKRLRKMSEAVDAFSHDLENLEGYTPLTIKEEFPESGVYREAKFPGIEPCFPEMIRNLLADVKRAAQAVDLKNIKGSQEVYVQLVVPASILLESRLLQSFYQDINPIYSLRRQHAERLKHRLTKICQYYHGVTDLILHAKRAFRNGLRHCWVTDITGTGETTVELVGNHLDAISRAFGNPLSETTLAYLRHDFPDMEEKWDNSRLIDTQLHAEIRIVLHLSNTLNNFSDDLNLRLRQLPIGCSKRSCLCCTLWIEAYNETFDTRYLTSGSRPKPCAAWALPGCSYEGAHTRDGRSIVDEAVLSGVGRRLSETLDLHFPSQKHQSSGSVSGSGSDKEAILRARFTKMFLVNN